jgi:putative ABC transport system permease protein
MAEPRLALRLYRLLLRLYPAQFRQDYEREILLAFRREWEWQSGHVGAFLYFMTAITGILLNAPKEHMEMLFDDLRYAWRTFVRGPWFTLVAAATLALGMGVNSALFSVVKSVILEDLPYAKASQLVRVWIRNPKQGIDRDISNWPRLEDWRRAHCFDGVAGFTNARLIYTGGSEPLQLRGASVTANFFRMMGVHLLVGHDFEEGDDQTGRPRKIILSHGFWLRQFGGDSNIVGQQLTLSGESYQVAGIAPPFVRFPDRDLDFWNPLVVDDNTRRNRSGFWMNVAGRLRNGVTLSQAQREIDAFSQELAAQHAEDRDLAGVLLVSLQDDLTGPIRPALAVLSGAVAFILLICCANIAGMLSARAADRAHELSIRAALGAGRSRVTRQLLTEALLLFVLGGAVGIGVAYAGVALLLRLAPAELPQLQDTHLDLTVALFTLAVAAAGGLIFGLLPALSASHVDLASTLRQGSRGLAGRLDSRRFRSALTIGEMALAMILLTGAGLLIRSFERVQHVAPGFDSRRVAIAQLQLPRSQYNTGRQTIDFYDRLLDRLRHTPGVESASAITSFFLGRLPNSAGFNIEGRPDRITVPLTTDVVTPEFFSTMRIPLVRGRFFDSRDRANSPPVILINNTTATRYWPGADPIGKRITFGQPGQPGTEWYTIVGVVGDTSRAGPDQPVFTESYGPMAQGASRGMQILIRGAGTRAALQSAVRALDPGQPIARFGDLDSALGEQVASRRFTTLLLTLFAVTALVITGVGLYGLISYLVTQRRREFGIRAALGAQPADVLRIVLSRVGLMAAAGMAAGVLGAAGVSRLLDGLLFGVTHFDAASYLAAAAGLLLVCLAAAASPAVRAVRADPLSAIRAE